MFNLGYPDMSDDPLSDQRDADMEMARKHVQQLSEHFETVHIFTSRHMPAEHDGTVTLDSGCGHWAARVGQINQWVIYQQERERIRARKNDE